MPDEHKHPGYPVDSYGDLSIELRKTNELLQELVCLLREKKKHDNVDGGAIAQIKDGTMSLVTITPGNTPKFQVTPAFSGAPFTLVAAQASITSSDPTNFPVQLDPTDPTGTIFEAAIPADAAVPTGGEAVTVEWVYTNVDGTKATVTGTVTENGIVDDVVGGTFAQVA